MQAETNSSQNSNAQIARSAGTVMAAFVISKFIGLLATSLTARVFGTSPASNCFFAANRFSEIIFNLVAGGALGSAFIPVFTGLLVKKDRQKAWKLAASITNLVTLVLILVSILSMIFARQVVHYVLAPGFNPRDEMLTAQLLRIQVISSVIFGISGLVMGILNAHQKFFLPRPGAGHVPARLDPGHLLAGPLVGSVRHGLGRGTGFRAASAGPDSAGAAAARPEI